MKPRLPVLLLAALPLLLPGAALAAPAPPAARVEVVRDTLHGVVVEDPYRWLESKDAPETRAWIDAENAYRESLMAGVPGREALRARLGQLLQVDGQGSPAERAGRLFFWKRRADQQQRVLVMRRAPDAPDEVLFDPTPLSEDHTTSAVYLGFSRAGTIAAIGVREGGADELTVGLYDTDTKQPLPDRLPKARYFSFAFTPDAKGLYYARHTAQGPRVYLHVLGSDPAQDRLVFGEGYGLQNIIDITEAEDGPWLLLTVYYGSSASHTELWAKDLATDGPIVPVIKDVDAYFGGSIVGDRLFMETDWKAPRRRLLLVDLRDPAPERWKEIVPQGPDVIEGFSLAGGRIFVQQLHDVASAVRVYGPDGRPQGSIAFPTLGSVSGIDGRWTSDRAYFTFQSFAVPPTIYRYDVAAGKRSEWWRSPAPVRSDDFVTEQVWYRSKDGTRVPMFLVHRKGLRPDGRRPVYLTGYGGFDVNMTPSFSASAALWAEHDGVYALPTLRGGGEFGEAWHEAGMLGRKQNVFDDFIGAAEWLVSNHWTRPASLAIEGGSNGGLLVGAALTQRPELFRAVICAVPLLDMLRYQDFLVARYWVPEYGSSEDSLQFQWLRAYSPYQHVVKGTPYPAVLLVSGDSDTRVDPLHARKMTALLQASTGSDRPVLLHYDTKAGHAGGKPVGKQIDDTADELEFLFWQLGLDAGGAGGADARGTPR